MFLSLFCRESYDLYNSIKLLMTKRKSWTYLLHWIGSLQNLYPSAFARWLDYFPTSYATACFEPKSVRVTSDWDLWRTLYWLSYSAAARSIQNLRCAAVQTLKLKVNRNRKSECSCIQRTTLSSPFSLKLVNAAFNWNSKSSNRLLKISKTCRVPLKK